MKKKFAANFSTLLVRTRQGLSLSLFLHLILAFAHFVFLSFNLFFQFGVHTTLSLSFCLTYFHTIDITRLLQFSILHFIFSFFLSFFHSLHIQYSTSVYLCIYLISPKVNLFRLLISFYIIFCNPFCLFLLLSLPKLAVPSTVRPDWAIFLTSL